MRTLISVLCLLLLLTTAARAQTNARVRAEVAAINRYEKELDAYTKRRAKSARIFGNLASGTTEASDKWTEFRTERARERADTGENLNENALVWLREGKPVRATFTFQSPSRDWAHFITYDYRADGTLAKQRAELNTFYGNLTVIRERFYDPAGKLLHSTDATYHLGTRRRAKPAADLAEFINRPLPLYQSVGALPFQHLLKK